mgnify:CR=1 FL=1
MLIRQGPHGADLRRKQPLPRDFRQQSGFFPRSFKPHPITSIGRLIQALAQGLTDGLHEGPLYDDAGAALAPLAIPCAGMAGARWAGTIAAWHIFRAPIGPAIARPGMAGAGWAGTIMRRHKDGA